MDSQPLFPTPPASGSAQGSQVQGQKFTARLDRLDCSSLARHTCFLQQVITLHSSCHSVMEDGSTKKVVYDSLSDSLTLLYKHLGTAEYSWTLQKNCVQVIVSLLNKTTGNFLKGLLEKVNSLCSTLISKIETVDDSCPDRVSNLSTYHMVEYSMDINCY